MEKQKSLAKIHHGHVSKTEDTKNREKKHLLFTKEKTIWETADFSSETIELEWHSMANTEEF